MNKSKNEHENFRLFIVQITECWLVVEEGYFFLIFHMAHFPLYFFFQADYIKQIPLIVLYARDTIRIIRIIRLLELIIPKGNIAEIIPSQHTRMHRL